MTRKLPWLDRSARSGAPKNLTAARSPKSMRHELGISAEDDRQSTHANLRPKEMVQQNDMSRHDREPSTSPPPPPPEEMFMVDGYDNDDKYRMVEDEFMDAARYYTQHLHAVHYQEIKRLSRSRNAATISNIVRPTSVPMPDSTRRKVEGISRSKKQKVAIQKLMREHRKEQDETSGSENENEAWTGTALHGLMRSPQKASAKLGRLGPLNTSATRAAAGFKEASSALSPSKLHSEPTAARPPIMARFTKKEEELTNDETTMSEDDDNDLDAPVRSLKLTPQAKSALTMEQRAVAQVSSFAHSKYESLDDTNAGAMPLKSAVSHKKNEMQSSATSRQDRRLYGIRQSTTKRRNKQEEENTSLDIIPTFL